MMAKHPLFSTYRQGENRVTSSMLAVFERIDLSLLETILAAAAGESSCRWCRSPTSHPPSKGRSVADARISANFAYWFEVKTTRNALDPHQLAEHLTSGVLSPQPRHQRERHELQRLQTIIDRHDHARPSTTRPPQ
jgi:hypothetical protein